MACWPLIDACTNALVHFYKLFTLLGPCVAAIGASAIANLGLGAIDPAVALADRSARFAKAARPCLVFAGNGAFDNRHRFDRLDDLDRLDSLLRCWSVDPFWSLAHITLSVWESIRLDAA